MFRLAIVALVSFVPFSPGVQPAVQACVGLSAPVAASVTEHFAPVGAYAGHWGIDYQTNAGQRVGAAAPGWVSFAGVVAGNTTVTVDHGGGLKTSYSYLDEVWVGRGATVSSGSVVGTSGSLHGGEETGLHFSTRIDGVYVDPAPLLGCPSYTISDALRLVPAP